MWLHCLTLPFGSSVHCLHTAGFLENGSLDRCRLVERCQRAIVVRCMVNHLRCHFQLALRGVSPLPRRILPLLFHSELALQVMAVEVLIWATDERHSRRVVFKR